MADQRFNQKGSNPISADRSELADTKPSESVSYGDRGNYVAVVGNLNSHSLSSNVAESITTKTGLPANAAAAPRIGLFENYFRSDHANYPVAVLVTDTANFRLDGKHDDYHSENDTPDHVKYSKVAKVAAGISAWLKDEDQSAEKNKMTRRSPTNLMRDPQNFEAGTSILMAAG